MNMNRNSSKTSTNINFPKSYPPKKSYLHNKAIRTTFLKDFLLYKYHKSAAPALQYRY